MIILLDDIDFRLKKLMSYKNQRGLYINIQGPHTYERNHTPKHICIQWGSINYLKLLLIDTKKYVNSKTITFIDINMALSPLYRPIRLKLIKERSKWKRGNFYSRKAKCIHILLKRIWDTNYISIKSRG